MMRAAPAIHLHPRNGSEDTHVIMPDIHAQPFIREVERLRADYLDLVCNSVVGRLNRDPPLQTHLTGYDDEHRLNGWDWPSGAPSMIGWKRMRHLRNECERVIVSGVPGDFLEAGVWRGGAAIMMRAVLRAYGDRQRRVIAADSFCGMPPDTDLDDSAGFLRESDLFAVSLEDVRSAFHRYDLLDDQVVFLPGDFSTTLSQAPADSLAILRLDGDTYRSAKAALEALYDKVTDGGSIILDDYALFSDFRRAIDEFRAARDIADPIVNIDSYGSYWIKNERRWQRTRKGAVRSASVGPRGDHT